MKTRLCQFVVRSMMGLVILTLVAIGLLWTEPLDIQTVALNWKPPAQGSWGLTCGRRGSSSSSLDAASSQERGVGLLHTWTDSELFRRVEEAEKNLSSNSKNSNSSSHERKPKIAFLFLIQDGLPFAPLWNKFFSGHDDLYNIYIHMWPLRLSTFQPTKGAFFGRLIPSQEGKRLTPGLIADGRRLMANALLDDPSNEWFAMVSESCIPIHGFRYVYKSLASTDKTYMEVNPNHWDMPNRYKARGDDAMKPEIEQWQFRVGSQFWVMRKKHALMTVLDNKYWQKFNHPCLPQYANCFPEEHYFPTLLNILDPGGTTGPTTLVDWSKMENGGHPRMFHPDEINRPLIKSLQEMGNGRFLFARKFEVGCLKPLLDIADAIVDH